MRLYTSSASPFVAKVRMAARHCGIDIDSVPVDTAQEPADLLQVNPLGKIPALLAENGTAIYDSRVICEWLDRKSGSGLLPQTDEAWLQAKTIEATADGVIDAMILVVYESRYRPDEKRHEPWVEKQRRRAGRGLDVLEGMVTDLPAEPNLGHFALAALLGWLDLRFPGEWRDGRPTLSAWIDNFPAAFPAFEELKPRAS